MALIYDDKTGQYFDSKSGKKYYNELDPTEKATGYPGIGKLTQIPKAIEPGTPGFTYDPTEIATGYPGTENLPGYGRDVGLTIPFTPPKTETEYYGGMTEEEARWQADQDRMRGYTPTPTDTGGTPPTDTTPPPPQPQPPVIPETPPQTDWWQTIMDLFGSMGYNAPGSQEPFLPSTSTSELSQVLQDRAMQMLNRPYGYTPEEEALIYQNALNRFNLNREEDVRNLENMTEYYGWNRGAGEMGGQGKNAFEDYFGKRAISEAALTGDIAQQIATKRSEDEQRALTQAQNIEELIYGEYNQDFNNMLSLMDFNQAADAQQFNQIMQVAGFQSDEEQRNFMNQLGISDREQDAYWKTRQYEDQSQMQWLNYLQETTGLTAEQLLTAMSYADSNEAHILQSSIEKEPMVALATAILLGMYGQDLFNTDTDGIELPKINLPGIGEIDINWLKDIPGIDWGNIDWNNPLTWPNWTWDILGASNPQLQTPGVTFRYGDKEYTVGADSKISKVKNIGSNPTETLPETPEVPGYIKTIGDITATYGIYRTVRGVLQSRGWWPEELGGGAKESMTEEDLPFVAWTYLEQDMPTKASQILNSMNPFEELAFFNEMKNGRLQFQKKDKDGNIKTENLKSINLNDAQIGFLRKYGFHDAPYKLASDENIQKILNTLPDENSTATEWLKYAKDAMYNGLKYDARYFQKQGYTGMSDYLPPISKSEYITLLDQLMAGGMITTTQYSDSIKYMADMEEFWKNKK